MELRIENTNFNGNNLYSVIYDSNGVDRLVIQTTDRGLAHSVLEHGWTDGFQITKEVMERLRKREPSQIIPRD